MSCANPIASEALVDYWARAVDGDGERRVEEHVFFCDDCAQRWRSMRELAESIGEVVRRRGGVQLILTPRIAAQLESSGLKLRTYRAAPGEVVPCGVGADDDLVVSWLSADFSGAERIDLISRSGGQTLRFFEDVPIDRDANRIGFTLSAEEMRSWPSMMIEIELRAGDRAVARYVFNHPAFSR
jgi:hypothetical protein